MFLLLSVLFLPFILAIGCLVLVMTCSWSKNVRKGYVDLLLKIFQVGLSVTTVFVAVTLYISLMFCLFPAVWHRKN